jgi:MIP family channel proteins
VRHLRLGPALGAEGIGTFVLVLGGCGAIAVDSVHGGLGPAGIAAAFGLAIMVMVYALGHVSGAHFNPAVTLAFAVSGHLPWGRVVPYWTAQVTGAILATVVLRLTLGANASLGVTHPSGGLAESFIWELLLTAILMLVITAVVTDGRAAGHGAAIAIGGAVALGALVGGSISGASMNPARSLGPALIGQDLSSLWIYLTAPVLGAAVAALAYDRLREVER